MEEIRPFRRNPDGTVEDVGPPAFWEKNWLPDDPEYVTIEGPDGKTRAIARRDLQESIEVGDLIQLQASGIFEPKTVTLELSEVDPQTVKALLGKCTCECHSCCVPDDASCGEPLCRHS